MTTPHKHAEFVHAWADGKEIQQRAPISIAQYQPNLRTWVPFDGFWHDHYEYRIKPAAPVIETKMTDYEIKRALVDYGMDNRALINAAIARAIADGQVVPIEQAMAMRAPLWDRQRVVSAVDGYEFEADGTGKDMDRLLDMISEFGRMKDERAKRDMAVALAAYNLAFKPCSDNSAIGLKERLSDLIAKVLP